MSTLLEMANKKYEACGERFEYIFKKLEQLKVRKIVSLQEDMVDDDLELDENGGVSSKCMKSLENLLKSLKIIVKNWQCLDSILLGMILN